MQQAGTRLIQARNVVRHAENLLVLCNFACTRYSSHYTVTKTKITPTLTLRTVVPYGNCRPDKSRPIVLLFPWLYPKSSAVDKYADLYHQAGLDVLTIDGKLKHFLWPKTAFRHSEELFQYLFTERGAFKEKYLVHAFSVGAYNYTIAMVHSKAKEGEFGDFKDRVVGQIFDSVVIGTYDNMSTGIASLVTTNKMVHKLLINTMNIYYNSTKKHTKDEYDRLVKYFIEESIEVPTLVFYSRNDPMSEEKAMMRMLRYWKDHKHKMDVDTCSWDKSVHAAHLKYHREEYLQRWHDLINKTGVHM